MTIAICKWVSQVEEIRLEGGQALEIPLRRVVVAAVCSNPYAGRYSEDLSELIDFGGEVAAELSRRCLELLGTTAEAFGKGGVVGEHGEVEHVAAVLHPKFGAPVREAVQGVSILPSVKKRGGVGTHLDIPVHNTKAILVRSHFDAVEFYVPDAPHADELVVALAVSSGGRPNARVGGLRLEDAIGEDGLR